MRTAFVADMHLKPGRQPKQNALLRRFLLDLRTPGGQRVDRLVMLGDIFNGWFERGGRVVGDFADILAIFREAVDDGLDIYHICGNRDFAVARGLPLPWPATDHGRPDGWQYEGFLRGWKDVFNHGGNGLPSERGGISAIARAGIYLCGMELRLQQDGEWIRCLHGDQLCFGDWGHQMLRWWMMSLASRLHFASSPFFVLDFLVSSAQGRDVFPHVFIPSARNLADEALVPLIDGGDDAIFCGHFHYHLQREVRGQTRTGRLVIFKCWSNTGEYGILENRQLRICKCGD